MPTSEELAFFAEKRDGLEMLYAGKYVLIKGRALIGAYDHADDVFREVSVRFGTEPCLVRHLSNAQDREGM